MILVCVIDKGFYTAMMFNNFSLNKANENIDLELQYEMQAWKLIFKRLGN